MNLQEYSTYDALGLAELIKRREVTAYELGQLMIQAVAKVNPQINAVIETYDARLETLRHAPLKDAPFAGVPFLLKDFGAGGFRLYMAQRRNQVFLKTWFLSPLIVKQT